MRTPVCYLLVKSCPAYQENVPGRALEAVRAWAETVEPWDPLTVCWTLRRRYRVGERRRRRPAFVRRGWNSKTRPAATSCASTSTTTTASGCTVRSTQPAFPVVTGARGSAGVAGVVAQT